VARSVSSSCRRWSRVVGCVRHAGATTRAKRVRRFTILEEEAALNNVLRGFTVLRVAVS
jgi:hypothetical protein